MGFFNNLQGLGLGFGTSSEQSSPSSKNMYPQELEVLINIAVEDGDISDKERLVLYKKAAKFGVDPDELDMVLESRLNGVRRAGSSLSNVESQPNVSKRKGPKKCPSCGAVLSDENSVHCPYCGYKVVNLVSDILEEINSVVVPKKVRQNTGFFGNIVNLIESDAANSQVLELKENIILSYHIPVAKEAILEFLAYSVQKGRKDVEFDFWDDELGEAWYKKSEQIITEARRKFSEDADFIARLKDYAIKLGMEKRGLFRR